MKNLKLATSPQKASLMIVFQNGIIENSKAISFNNKYRDGSLSYWFTNEINSEVLIKESDFPYKLETENFYGKENKYETCFYEIE